MVLSNEDADLFYELFFSLLDFANKKFRINPKIGDIYKGKSLKPQDAWDIAEAIWSNADLIDEYLLNVNLPTEHESIVLGWKKGISGQFIVERHLKKGSVFISAQDEQVYLVSGNIDSWDELLGGRPLPAIIETTLIPFKDVIISDGLVLAPYFYIGRNMALEFKEIYLDAKKNGRIIKSL